MVDSAWPAGRHGHHSPEREGAIVEVLMAPGEREEAGVPPEGWPSQFLKACCSLSFSHCSPCPEQCSLFNPPANSH